VIFSPFTFKLFRDIAILGGIRILKYAIAFVKEKQVWLFNGCISNQRQSL
jgi:hypothetical protein